MVEFDQFNSNLARAFYVTSCVFALFGVFCNLILLMTTIKTSTLRSTCNILIGICAVADIVHQIGTLSQLPLLFGYLLEMSSDYCMIIMVLYSPSANRKYEILLYLPEMGVATGVAAIFAVGLDRMLSLFISGWNRSLNKRIFHCLLAFLMIGYCASFTFLMVAYYQKRVVICGMLSPYPDAAVIWFRIINLAANGATAVVYTITWLGLQVYKDAPGMKRIMKSLFYIAAADVCGWLLTPALIELIQHLNLNSSQMFAWTYFGTIFINVAMSFKLLIYYSTSTEYRQAINAFLVPNRE